MRAARRTLIVLVVAVTALSGAFDGCLTDCHAAPVAGTQAHDHCHTAASAPDAVRWQADPTCHHDHAGAAAEAARQTRLDSRPLAVESFAQQLNPPPAPVRTSIVVRTDTGPSAPTLASVPLRV